MFLRAVRSFSAATQNRGQTIKTILTDNLSPNHLKVVDVSGLYWCALRFLCGFFCLNVFLLSCAHNNETGGCGQMFQIEVASAKFEGLTLVSQHRLVKDLLSAEIKEMHGLSLKTFTPAQAPKQQ